MDWWYHLLSQRGLGYSSWIWFWVLAFTPLMCPSLGSCATQTSIGKGWKELRVGWLSPLRLQIKLILHSPSEAQDSRWALQVQERVMGYRSRSLRDQKRLSRGRALKKMSVLTSHLLWEQKTYNYNPDQKRNAWLFSSLCEVPGLLPASPVPATRTRCNCTVWNGGLQSFTCGRIYNIYWFSSE